MVSKKNAVTRTALDVAGLLIGGGVETPDKSTHLNAIAAVKSAAETCGV